jgi:hypothetical protein
MQVVTFVTRFRGQGSGARDRLHDFWAEFSYAQGNNIELDLSIGTAKAAPFREEMF